MVDDKRERVRKFPHQVIVRAPGLLPMLYSPMELGHELGISPRSIREWAKQGLPHSREGMRIWVDGRECADWIERERKMESTHRLGPDEGYCVRCRKPVPLTQVREVKKGKMLRWSGTCPACGSTVNRGGRIDQSA